MDKSLWKGIAAGPAAVVAIGGIAGYEVSHRQTAYADVLKTEPVVETIKTPRQVCKDEAVTRKAPVQDRERVAGTAIGAVVGGMLGHQIGGGSGRTVATVGGAALGGYAGNQLQKNLQDSDAETTPANPLQNRVRPHGKAAGLQSHLSPGRYGQHDPTGLPSRRSHPGQGRQTGAEPASGAKGKL